MLRVYGCPNTRSTRVTWALEEAGAEYEFIPVDLSKGEHKQPAFLAVNPAGKVPALVDGDLTLTESAAICAYIGDRFPASGLLPQEAADRAHVLQWAFFVMSELETPLWTLAKHTRYLPEERRVPAVVDTCVWEFQRAAGVLQQHLTGRDFAVGDRFSLADILISATLNWARSMGITFDNDALPAYADRMASRTALQRARDREAKAVQAG